MRIPKAMGIIASTDSKYAVFLTERGGHDVRIWRLLTSKQERTLNKWIRDKEFAQSFVGVYDRNTDISDLWDDVDYVQRQREAA